MDEERKRQNKKEPTGMSREAFREKFIRKNNEVYNGPFEIVKRECNKDIKDELPNNITT